MALIEYCGKKAVKHDSVAGTGLVWVGFGAVHEVSDPVAVGKLLHHTDSWRLAEVKQEPKVPDEKPIAPQEIGLEAMADKQVREFALSKGIKPHHKKNGASLRAYVREALGKD